MAEPEYAADMDPVPTHYIDRDGAALAYQVVGDGPVDIVHFLEISQHIDLMWTDPDIHHNFEHVARVARNVMFQRRGIGLSDQVPYVPTLEQQADDVIAIMDAVGVRQRDPRRLVHHVRRHGSRRRQDARTR